MGNPFRQLPSVNQLLESAAVKALMGEHAHDCVAAAVRAELDDVRQILAHKAAPDGWLDHDAIAARVADRVSSTYRPKLQRVINATGIVLHTNLGRAPLADDAARA